MQCREMKLVVLGDDGTGKSTIVIRKIQNIFVEEYDPFIEDGYPHTIDLNGEQVMLDILDTISYEEYDALRDRWIREGDGFIIVYSITSRNNFDNCHIYRDQIYRTKDIDDDGHIPIIIVGSKIDLENERQVTIEEGEQFADRNGVDFIECSAKANINITELFESITLNVITNSTAFRIDSTPKKHEGVYCVKYSLLNNELISVLLN